jgi:hypothetical protein
LDIYHVKPARILLLFFTTFDYTPGGLSYQFPT